MTLHGRFQRLNLNRVLGRFHRGLTKSKKKRERLPVPSFSFCPFIRPNPQPNE